MEVFKIFIDAGHNHYGWDTGAQGYGLREQDITFNVAKLIKEKLASYNVYVFLSRSKKTDNVGLDLNSSLIKRADMANEQEVDLFMSIHCNSEITSRAFGTEVYTYSENSKVNLLANNICDSICAKLETHNRGVKHSNFVVLKNTKMPAMLIELAFLSNSEDAEKLKTRQEDFASAIASQIISYYNLEVIKKELVSANDIIWELINGKHKIEISDITRAVQQLEKAKQEESSLYWILRKLVNK